MKEETNNIAIINFDSYIKPEIIESVGRTWVKYGVKNDYYQYLIDRGNGSPTNGALITGIAGMIYGKGISALDASVKPQEYANMKVLFRDEEIRKMVTDLKWLGGGALQVIYNSAHTEIVEVYHIPTESLRAEKVGENGEIEGYYYAKDWTRIYGKGRPVRLPAFGTSKEPLEILFIKAYRPGSFYYSPPDYQSGLTYSELEEEIANYHITNIKNGFSPTTLINFNNGQVTTPEEKQRLEQKLRQKFSGTTGAKIVLSFNNGVDTETHMETVQLSDAHNQYEFLSTEAQKKILVAHRGSAILFGIETSTGFGSNAEEVKNQSIWMHNKVIEPIQELIINSLDKILEFNKSTLDLYFITNQPTEWLEAKEDIEKTEEGTENVDEPEVDKEEEQDNE